MKANVALDCSPVDRRDGLSLREFKREYLFPGRPVVITDALENWRARSTWTLDYFKTRYGHQQITVFKYHNRKYQSSDAEQVCIAEFVDAIQKGDWRSYPYYVRDDWKIFIDHKELMDDYQVPKYFFDWFVFLPSFMRLIYPRIFMGPKGAITPLHHDIWGTHAWLSQLVGRKRWFLFSPDQRRLLYEYQVEANAPDFERYPLLKEARPLECVIGPGDTIFVPGGWAHEVISLDPTLSITHNYMGPGCFSSSLTNCVRVKVLDRLRGK